MWEWTHTCCSQKIKLGPLYIIHCFNGRQKWEIWSICLVSMKYQEKIAMSLLQAIWIKKVRQEAVQRPYGGLMEECGGEQCHHQNADVLRRSPGCHISFWEILLSPVCSNRLSPGDSAAVIGDADSQRAVWVVRAHTHTLMYLPSRFLSGGLVQHGECGWPRPSSVWQHVRAQQLKTRPKGPQTGARRVCGEYYGIWWDCDSATLRCYTSFQFYYMSTSSFTLNTL